MTTPLVSPVPLSRREALQRIILAAGAAATLNLRSFGAGESPGIGFDPNLLKKEIPWSRILTEAEKKCVTALADLIIPADEFGPAASAVGVPDFIDEWVSAPYDQQMKDRGIIRGGIGWLEAQAQQRHGKTFAECTAEQQSAILDPALAEGATALKEQRSFFLLFRDRVAGGYYSTPEGWKAIGYTGNVPSPEFAGPPPEALQHIGLA